MVFLLPIELYKEATCANFNSVPLINYWIPVTFTFHFFLLRESGSFGGALCNSSPREARLLVKLSNRRLISLCPLVLLTSFFRGARKDVDILRLKSI